MEDTGVVGRIILRYLKMGRAVLVWRIVALERGHVAGCHKHSRTYLGSKKLVLSLATREPTSQPAQKISTVLRKSIRISNFMKILQ